MIHFGKDIRNTVQVTVDIPSGEEPTVQQVRDWHQDATADTGTSHALPGRGYLVLCEWCEDAFFASSKAEAMNLFWAHEDSMMGGN